MAAAALPKLEESGGLKDILSLFSTGSSLFGSGKATTTERTAADPSALAMLDEVFNKSMNTANSGYLDDLVSNILERAKQNFAPNIANSIGSGNRAYSDTTLAGIARESAARATGEAAAAKLQAITQATQTATQAATAKVNATKVNTKTTQAGASPTGKALGVAGLGLTGYSLYKKAKKAGVFGDDASLPAVAGGVGTNVGSIDAGTFFGGTGTDLSSFGNGPANPFGFITPESLSLADVMAPVDQIADPVAGQENDGITDAAAGNSDTLNALELTEAFSGNIGAGAFEGANAASTFFNAEDAAGISDVASNLENIDSLEGLDAYESLSGIEGATSFDIGIPAGAGRLLQGDVEGAAGTFLVSQIPVVGPVITAADAVLGSNIGSEVGEFAFDTAEDVVTGVGSVATDAISDGLDTITDVLSGDSVICTELVRQGKLSWKEVLEHVVKTRKRLSAKTFRGYHYIAIPIVHKMRSNKELSEFLLPWAKDYCMEKGWRFQFVKTFLEPVCFLIGSVVDEQNTGELYGRIHA